MFSRLDISFFKLSSICLIAFQNIVFIVHKADRIDAWYQYFGPTSPNTYYGENPQYAVSDNIEFRDCSFDNCLQGAIYINSSTANVLTSYSSFKNCIRDKGGAILIDNCLKFVHYGCYTTLCSITGYQYYGMGILAKSDNMKMINKSSITDCGNPRIENFGPYALSYGDFLCSSINTTDNHMQGDCLADALHSRGTWTSSNFLDNNSTTTDGGVYCVDSYVNLTWCNIINTIVKGTRWALVCARRGVVVTSNSAVMFNKVECYFRGADNGKVFVNDCSIDRDASFCGAIVTTNVVTHETVTIYVEKEKIVHKQLSCQTDQCIYDLYLIRVFAVVSEIMMIGGS